MKKQELISIENPTPEENAAPVTQIKQSNIINAKRTEINEYLLKKLYNETDKEEKNKLGQELNSIILKLVKIK